MTISRTLEGTASYTTTRPAAHQAFKLLSPALWANKSCNLTYGHCDLIYTESAQWAVSVKKGQKTSKRKKIYLNINLRNIHGNKLILLQCQ